jgi:tripartite-type tricarboxylate transporter receptor subunit TctC
MGCVKRSSASVLFIVFFSISAWLAGAGLAQESYPNRAVTMVVPWGPGGMSDTITRTFAKAAEKILGQPIIVENKAGGGGSIGVNYALKAKPDGYTLGIPQTSAYIIHPHMKKLPYHPLTDAVDILPITDTLMGIGVRADAPWNTFEDVVAYARNNPGKFTYAHAGIGSVQHICMERIAMEEGIKWTQVPFKSGLESTVACLGGHTDAVAQTSIEMLPHLKAGKLKFLLSLSDERWPDYPTIPNVLARRYNFWAIAITGINAPRGLPEPILRKLEEGFIKARKDPAFRESMENFKVKICTMSGKEYSNLWRSKYDEMGRVIKILGIQE